MHFPKVSLSKSCNWYLLEYLYSSVLHNLTGLVYIKDAWACVKSNYILYLYEVCIRWINYTNEHCEYCSNNTELKMTDSILSLNLIECLTSCLCFASGATIFYKRTFRRDMLPLTFLFILLSISLHRSSIYKSRVSWAITFGLSCLIAYNIVKHKKWLKTLPMDFFFTFLMAVLDIEFNIYKTMLENAGILSHMTYYLGEPVVNWTRIVLVVIPQFIRNPPRIKAKLQGLRSKLGPIYVIYCAKFIMDYTQYNNNTICKIQGLTSLVAAILSAVVFRPDNSVILQLLGYDTTLKKRRFIHGRGMIISLGLCVLMVLQELTNIYSDSNTISYLKM